MLTSIMIEEYVTPQIGDGNSHKPNDQEAHLKSLSGSLEDTIAQNDENTLQDPASLRVLAKRYEMGTDGVTKNPIRACELHSRNWEKNKNISAAMRLVQLSDAKLCANSSEEYSYKLINELSSFIDTLPRDKLSKETTGWIIYEKAWRQNDGFGTEKNTEKACLQFELIAKDGYTRSDGKESLYLANCYETGAGSFKSNTNAAGRLYDTIYRLHPDDTVGLIAHYKRCMLSLEGKISYQNYDIKSIVGCFHEGHDSKHIDSTIQYSLIKLEGAYGEKINIQEAYEGFRSCSDENEICKHYVGVSLLRNPELSEVTTASKIFFENINYPKSQFELGMIERDICIQQLQAQQGVELIPSASNNCNDALKYLQNSAKLGMTQGYIVAAELLFTNLHLHSISKKLHYFEEKNNAKGSWYFNFFNWINDSKKKAATEEREKKEKICQAILTNAESGIHAGDMKSYFIRGNYYSNGVCVEKTKENLTIAYKDYQSCKDSHIECLNQYSHMYYMGIDGVVTQNCTTALIGYDIGAKQHNTQSLLFRGDYFFEGKCNNVAKDYKKAFHDYETCSKSPDKNIECVVRFGYMKSMGYGTSKSCNIGLESIKQCINEHSHYAYYVMGIFYRDAICVKKDISKAEEYFKSAFALGNDEASSALVELESQKIDL